MNNPAAREGISGNYLGTNFRLYFDSDEEIQRELTDYLSFHFQPVQPQHPEWKIVISSAGATPGEDNWERQRDICGSVVITDEQNQHRCYRLDPEFEPHHVIQDVYCGIRRIAARNLPDGILMHAACINIDGKTVAVFGHKGNGKSFLSYACMLLFNAAYVSGDKLCMWSHADGQLRCAGLIEGIRFNPFDIEMFSDHPKHHHLMARVQGYYSAGQRILNDKVCLSPRVVIETLGINSIVETALDTLIFLQSPQAPVRLYPVGGDACMKLIAEHLRGDSSPHETGFVAAENGAGRTMELLRKNSRAFILEGRPSVAWIKSRMRSISM